MRDVPVVERPDAAAPARAAKRFRSARDAKVAPLY
jgi:hypothetical protein